MAIYTTPGLPTTPETQGREQNRTSGRAKHPKLNPKVEKIIQYRIIYSFKGNGAAPNIIPQIIKVSETKCKKQFRYYLKKSKSLERAYRHPPESKIEEKENYSKENEKITFKDC